MKTRIAAFLVLLLALFSAEAQEDSRRDLTIEVQRDEWGDASIADIRAVLRSSAGELWKHIPDGRLDTILVSRSRKSPIVLFERGPKQEYRVKLNVKGTHWAQFAYQFAHEFCHILAKYDKDEDSNEWTRDGQSALFVIPRIAPGEIATMTTAVREAEFPRVAEPGPPDAWTIDVERYTAVRKAPF